MARSLRLALIALAIALAAIAAFAVSSVYRSRQSYENTLVSSSSLSTAAANLAAAGNSWLAVTNNTPEPRGVVHRH